MESAKKTLPIINTRAEVSLQEKAFLVHGFKYYPVQAERASKYSLFFRFLDDHHFTDTDKLVNLIIQKNGRHLELGPCRILPDRDLNANSGRLVFSRDVCDTESLLFQNKAAKLRLPIEDLNLLLAHKNKVRPRFRKYVADLSYDLSVYKMLFDDIDLKYSEEPDEVKQEVQAALIASEGPDFRMFFEKKLEELKKLVDEFSPQEHQLHGYYFRRQLWHFILNCPFSAQAALKPRGYAGDSELMRMIYLNNYQGNSTFSKLAHKHAVEHTAAQSVRYRLQLIPQMLNQSAKLFAETASERCRVLSVGCGPAYELQQILRSPIDCEKYHFTLFDQDSAALSEAAELAHEIERNLGVAPTIEYLQGSVRLMLFSRHLKQKWGQFHFIYSMGLLDYLNSRVATAVLERLYGLLKPGGEVVVGNFHVSNPSKYYMQYWGDWVLFHRTEEEFKSLFRNGSGRRISVLYDKTGSQMFLHIKKPAAGV